MSELKLLAYYFLAALITAALGYYILQLILIETMGHGHVFGSLYRMYSYHEAHAYSYISIACALYSYAATAFAYLHTRVAMNKAWLAVLVIPITIISASIPGGILWVIHDMAAGRILSGANYWAYLLWGGWTGLTAGWLVVFLSIPYALIGSIIAYFLTISGFDWYRRNANLSRIKI